MSADLQLLRDVLRYARAHGWTRDHHGPCGGLDKGTRRWEREGTEIDLDRFGTLDVAGLCEISVADLGLKCAVDTLVALGVLPAEFSSAYAAGRDAALSRARTEWGMRLPDGYVVGPHLREDYVREQNARHNSEGRPRVVVRRVATPWEASDAA